MTKNVMLCYFKRELFLISLFRNMKHATLHTSVYLKGVIIA